MAHDDNQDNKTQSTDRTPKIFPPSRCRLHPPNTRRNRSISVSRPAQSSLFFQLPVELRRMILVRAFGNENICMWLPVRKCGRTPIIPFPWKPLKSSCLCAPKYLHDCGSSWIRFGDSELSETGGLPPSYHEPRTCPDSGPTFGREETLLVTTFLTEKSRKKRGSTHLTGAFSSWLRCCSQG